MTKPKYTYSCYTLKGETKWHLVNRETKETFASGTVTADNYAEQVPQILDQVVKILNEVSESD